MCTCFLNCKAGCTCYCHKVIPPPLPANAKVEVVAHVISLSKYRQARSFGDNHKQAIDYATMSPIEVQWLEEAQALRKAR